MDEARRRRPEKTAHSDVSNEHGICFHEKQHSFHGLDYCHADHRDDIHFGYGRCQSGQRWFWFAGELFSGTNEQHGWAASEQEAMQAARAAVTASAAGRKSLAVYRADFASGKLKSLNRAKRAARRASAATDARPTEYLFSERSGIYDDGWNTPYHYIYAFPIVKKTAKRIYYKRKHLTWLSEIDAPDISESAAASFNITFDQHDTGFIDRREIEAKGEAYNHGRIGRQRTFICWPSRQRHGASNPTRRTLRG
jgi:hypothetical protein